MPQGGLGMRALAQWLFATFAAANFGGRWKEVGKRTTQTQEERDNQHTQRTRKRVIWEIFAKSWENSPCAQKWWWTQNPKHYKLTHF